METIEVIRADVIEKLKENRQKHIDAFTEANANYRQTVVDALIARSNDILGGGKINLYFALPEPEDHTEDYDEAIAALTWDQRPNIELTRVEFSQYVLDKWRWGQSFLANTVSYTAAAARP